MECGCSALTATIWLQYWFESGRVRDLVFRRNRMKDCNALGGSAFIRVSVSGFRDAETPKIHGRVEISDNTFHGVTNAAIRMAGVPESDSAGKPCGCGKASDRRNGIRFRRRITIAGADCGAIGSLLRFALLYGQYLAFFDGYNMETLLRI